MKTARWAIRNRHFCGLPKAFAHSPLRSRAADKVGHVTVGALLAEQGYMQGNKKTLEGTSHPDRDAQFQFIAERAKACIEDGQPVISVDTKKKELVGLYKNGGKSYRPKGDAFPLKCWEKHGHGADYKSINLILMRIFNITCVMKC
ncbi:MAG: hypothetical protein WAX48_03210 [Desulfosalsimonadaceae bacterium]